MRGGSAALPASNDRQQNTGGPTAPRREAAPADVGKGSWRPSGQARTPNTPPLPLLFCLPVGGNELRREDLARPRRRINRPPAPFASLPCCLLPFGDPPASTAGQSRRASKPDIPTGDSLWTTKSETPCAWLPSRPTWPHSIHF